MPKIFQFDNLKVDRRNRAEPMEASAWFRAQQPLLLWMANKSADGRRLLRLDQVNLPRIDRIGMNHVSMDRYERDGGFFVPKYRRVTTTDFRVGAKWANLINSQWDWFCELSREYYSLMERKRVLHVGQFAPVALFPGFAYGTTTTVYPDADPETTTVDGFVGRSGINETWGTIRAGAGVDANDTSADSVSMTYIEATTTTDQFGNLRRGIILFDASAIADTDVISAATLSIMSGTTNKSDTFSTPAAPDLNIYASTPNSNTSLVAGDYGQTGTTAFATAKAYADWAAAGSYNDFALNAQGLAAVSKTGVSKFSAKNANYDVANVAPTWSSLGSASIRGKMADTADTTSDPKLVVTHAAAATGHINLLLLGVG